MTMTRYREILRLHSLGNPIGEIAAAAGCHRNTVGRAIERAQAAGLEWPLPEELGDGQIARLLYPGKYGKHGDYAEPDYERVHRELKRKGVTRSLLYCEYRDACKAAGKEACSITTFNHGYAEWAARKSVVMHIVNRAALKRRGFSPQELPFRTEARQAPGDDVRLSRRARLARTSVGRLEPR